MPAMVGSINGDNPDLDNPLADNITQNTSITGETRTESITWDDATWILTSAFIIFTMQSGFGLLEAGSVSAKNEVNIMVKNAVDVIFGGLTYWMFGFGLSFGTGQYSTAFCGVGDFFVDTTDTDKMGQTYSTYIFQLSFATTATTIVSGAMAERTKLTAYVLFSLCNTVIYSIPAHWLWSDMGFLKQLGAIDVAGSSGVHLVGGVSGLVATLMLKPRIGRYEKDYKAQAGNMTNCVVGMFMLWWGWLGFNCGSTFGISGGKWKLAAKSAVTTINSSMGGGLVGLVTSYICHNKKFIVPEMVNSILGALVSVTAGCAVLRPWEAIVIGMVGGGISVAGVPMFDALHIDDPVGALSVHGLCGLWGMLAVGLFVEHDEVENINQGRVGLLKGGGPYLLGVQALACLLIMTWSGVLSFILLFMINKTVGLRVSEFEEMVGSDYVEHGITGQVVYDVELDHNQLEKGEIKPEESPRPSIGAAPPMGLIRSSYGILRRDVATGERRASRPALEAAMTGIFTVQTLEDSTEDNSQSRTTISTITEGSNSPT